MEKPPECGEVRCCYHCPKQKEGCLGGGGCSRMSLNGYPKKCKSYPLTFQEAKRIFVYKLLFETEKDETVREMNRYFEFSKKVETFIKEKKANAKAK